MKLKKSVKEKMQMLIAISVIILALIMGLIGMKKRTEQIENQIKMTDSVAINQSK